ncbi:DUF2218 domain-containing protein [Xinfangfangia sp. D13-10-4-6]|nr:DUF2218 domain-containing protein [Pseudogemmobacter hezensis]
MTSSARFETASGSKYLQQLCKHFAHKIEVEFDAHQGRAVLGPGPMEISADETGLSVRVSGEDVRSIIEARYIVDKHLVTFAFRDGFSGFAWKMDEAA